MALAKSSTPQGDGPPLPGPGGTAHLSAAYFGIGRRHQDGLHPLSRARTGHERHRGGPCRHDVRHAHDLAPIAPRRPHQDGGRRQPWSQRRRTGRTGRWRRLFPGYRAITWFGLVAPPNTPSALAERINRDVAEVLRRPEVLAKLKDMQMEPVGSSRAEAEKFFAEEAALWGKVIEDARSRYNRSRGDAVARESKHA